MKKTLVPGIFLTLALCLPGLASTEGLENTVQSQQQALSETQDAVIQLLGENKLESGAGRVLTVLYQELFALKDARRKNAVEIATTEAMDRYSGSAGDGYRIKYAGLKAEKDMINQDIKDLEAQIKDLTERLIKETAK